jgi:hypothetical protein
MPSSENYTQPARQETTDLPDVLTIIAIAIVATVAADVTHEALGHGGTCLLSGGHPLALSTVHFDCDRDTRLIAAGGTVANFIAGALFLVASRMLRRASRLGYFLWLAMTINLLEGGGYFLFSGFGNIGDWAVVIQGLPPAWAWRLGLIAIGAVSYWLVVWFSLHELRPFLGPEGEMRLRRARLLTQIPYFTDGILSCIAGLFNPVGMILVAISAAAASFGGASGLAWMGMLLRGPRVRSTEFQMPPITRSRGWIIAAGVLAILFIAVLGPGLRWSATK